MVKPLHRLFSVAMTCVMLVVWLPGRMADATDQIYVKLYIDEEERQNAERWKHRSRTRLHEASKILEKHSGIRFTLSDFGLWLSDNKTTEFGESLQEFEREARVGRNEIAIGIYKPISVSARPASSGWNARSVTHAYLDPRKQSSRGRERAVGGARPRNWGIFWERSTVIVPIP